MRPFPGRVIFATATSLGLVSAMGAQGAISQEQAVAKIAASVLAGGKTAEVRLAIPEGTKFNTDAPWVLKLSGAIVDKAKAREKFDRKDFDKNLGGFSIPLSAPVQPKELVGSKWALTYFLCNSANTWCKRVTSEGEFKIGT